MSSPPPSVLVFAASDPSGGAGAQADLLTLASLGCHPLTVLTALTVQDTHGVEAMRPIEASLVARQARCLLADLPVAAFKLGVLGSAENIAVIAAILAEHPDIPVVLDPVLASGRGDALASESMPEALLRELLPRSTLVTPNSLEARRLAGEDALACCARRLLERGARYVLITGAHEEGSEVVNTLYAGAGVVREDRWPRLAGSHHGSGCTLASAIAALLARGLALPDAVREAEDYTWHALAAGFAAGGGQLIPDRFFRLREPGAS
ncbi:MAG: hydroxymethylpyrimidine/phosphomethylpyrimidine kinase [Betaproteobacteria bacterium]|nr:hydroxymethylpyrimidine/phosphomethylpyrimidine kinase [Betaproteobacteria bacterium]